MRYHQQVRNEMRIVAEAFYNAPSVCRARAYRDLHMSLLGDKEDAVLPEPILMRILGREPSKDSWADIALRDTIERAWHREGRYFGRRLEREG